MDKENTLSLFFGGTAYLGIPHNETFRAYAFKGMEIYGLNYGASRNNNISLDIFSIAEKEAATRFHAEDSIILSSGYLAAQLVVQHFFRTHRLIYAPETHPALWIGSHEAPRLKFKDWAEETIRSINESNEPCLIISNSLNNLIPEIYDFDWIKGIDPSKKVILLIDDSHGIGICGEHGEGVYSRIPKNGNIETIVIASMAKALGVDAGIILGSYQIIKKLRSSAMYAGSSPPSPGMLYAFVKTKELYANELKNLRNNLRLFTDLLESRKDLFFIDDFPVFLLRNDALAADLIKNGTNISSFPYPDPQGNPLHRIIISSIHSKIELEILANEMNRL